VLIATIGVTTVLIAAGADVLRFALFIAVVGTSVAALTCVGFFAWGVYRDAHRDQ
jgi:hypothetical protein